MNDKFSNSGFSSPPKEGTGEALTILDQINETKRQEIAISKKLFPQEHLMASPYFGRKCNSLKTALLTEGSSGIIAEFKPKSPSKGIINDKAEVAEVTRGYVLAGVSGLSVLTDEEYFGGSIENLAKARFANPEAPILRKDFMLDPYQVYEAKAHGADVILLIAESLTKELLLELTLKAKELGLEVLIEVHNEEELEKLNPQVDIVGVNNRDLRTFKVDVETSVRLSKLIPSQFVKISESGISDPVAISKLRDAGFRGFLIGETFMKTDNPAKACKEFIQQLK